MLLASDPSSQLPRGGGFRPRREEGVLGNELDIAARDVDGRSEEERTARLPGELEGSVFECQHCGAHASKNRLTKEGMRNRLSADNRDSSMEYIGGAIEVCCRANGVFGLDRHHNG